MEQCKIELNSIPWESPAQGVRFKAFKQEGKQLRLVEFTNEFIEPDWCKKGHIGYILEGQLEINFNGNIVVFNPGDALLIPEGEEYKHMAKTITEVVRLFLIEEV